MESCETPDLVMRLQLPQKIAQNDRSEHVLDVGKLFGRWDVVWDRCDAKASPLGHNRVTGENK